MREAERQREEAIAYAESIKKDKETVEGRLSKLDKTYVSEFESRVKTNLAAAKLALKTAIEVSRYRSTSCSSRTNCKFDYGCS